MIPILCENFALLLLECEDQVVGWDDRVRTGKPRAVPCVKF